MHKWVWVLLMLGLTAGSLHAKGLYSVPPDTLIPAADSLSDRPIEIGEIYILGNKKTKEHIIVRELYFEKGDVFTLSELNQIIERDQQKIFNLRLFNSVNLTVLEAEPGKADVLIEVSERWYLFPIPLFKLADRNFNDWWANRDRDFSRVNYGLKLYNYNSRGRNERLRLIAQLGFTKQFELNYRIPYINKKQKEGLIFDFSFSELKNLSYNTDDHLTLFIRSEDNIYESWNANVSYSYRASFYSFHYVTLGFNSISVADTILDLNPNYLARGLNSNRNINIGYRFVRDLRDYVNYPLDGFYLMADVRKTGLGIYNDIDIFSAQLTYRRYFDLGKKWYLSSTVSGNVSTPLDQPYAFMQALGFGKDIIRGYELDVIEGPRYILSKTNLKRKLLGTTINLPNLIFEQFRTFPVDVYAKVFFDAGRVKNYPFFEANNNNFRLTENWLYSVGVGIDIVSAYDFVVRPEYSLNSEGDFNFFLNFQSDF